MENKIRNYETVIIMSASLEDEVLHSIQKKYEDFFKNNQIEVTEIEEWGRKRMTYPIQKVRTGYYLIIRFKADGNFVRKFERALEIDEQILRYLTVRLDKKALEFSEAQKSKPVAELAVEEIDDFEVVDLNLGEKDLSNNN